MSQIIFLPVLIFAVVVHECAHGLVAKWCGDNTADREGRITLNPISHFDLWGTVLVPLILVVSGSGLMFGWAKPVPVNPNNFRHMRRDDIYVSMAGPASNFIIAFISALGIVIVSLFWPVALSSESIKSFLEQLLVYSIKINLLLALFNLVPIPPLDGSHVVASLLPPHLGDQYRSLGMIGMLILLVMMSLGIINAVIEPFFDFLLGFLVSFIQFLVA